MPPNRNSVAEQFDKLTLSPVGFTVAEQFDKLTLSPVGFTVAEQFDKLTVSPVGFTVAELVEATGTMKGYMYILECANGKYYTGSTIDLERRIAQHQKGEGANFTKKHGPVKLLYFEEFQRIDQAFYREKQIQGWSRKKKEALINGKEEDLPGLSKNHSQFGAPTD